MQSVPISNAAWGVTLGVPFSFGLAAIASTIRWKGAKYVLAEPKVKTPNAPAQDEDEVENALWAGLAEDVEKKKKEKKQRLKEIFKFLAMYAVIGGVSFGLQYIPAWAQELYMVVLMSMPTALLGSVTLCDLTGLSKCRMARTSEGVLRAWDEYSNKGTAFFAPLLVAGVSCIAYVPNMPSPLQIALYAFFCAVVPFRVSVLFNHTKKDSMPLKWVLFGLTGLITAACALVAFVGGIIYVVVEYGLWTKVFGESKPSEPKPEKEVMSQSFLTNILPLQVCLFLGMIGIVISQLYRIDMALAEKKAASEGVRLESDSAAEEVQALYVKDTEMHSGEEKKEEKERVTCWMVLPSHLSLLRSGAIKHFLVRPRYSLLGLLTLQGLVMFLPSLVTQIALRMGAKWTYEADEVAAMASQAPLIACFIAPFAITLVIGAASLISGEARFVFNYQANWKVPVEKAEGAEGVSEPLLSEKNEEVEEK